MCGIVAAAARRNVVPLLIEGLRRLEYRGYASCGIATVGDDGLRRARSTQRVAELARQAKELNAPTGIAHTRWAWSTRSLQCSPPLFPWTHRSRAQRHY